MEWVFPDKKSLKNLYDFLLSLDAPSKYSFSSSEKEIAQLAPFFLDKTMSSPKSLSSPSPQLTGILYTSPNQWTIWIDNTPITPIYNPTSYSVLSVTPSNVFLKTSEGSLLLSLHKGTVY